MTTTTTANPSRLSRVTFLAEDTDVKRMGTVAQHLMATGHVFATRTDALRYALKIAAAGIVGEAAATEKSA